MSSLLTSIVPFVSLIGIVLTAVVGAIVTAVPYLRRKRRLRASITAELEMLKNLPEGNVHQELWRHVGRQVRALIAEETPLTARERNELTLAFAVAALGFLLPLPPGRSKA